MKEFFNRLTSRKFLLALGTAITLIANEQYGEAVTVIIAYITVEGGKDAVEAYKGSSSNQLSVINSTSQNVDDDLPIGGTVVTGNTPLFDEKEKDEE